MYRLFPLEKFNIKPPDGVNLERCSICNNHFTYEFAEAIEEYVFDCKKCNLYLSYYGNSGGNFTTTHWFQVYTFKGIRLVTDLIKNTTSIGKFNDSIYIPLTYVTHENVEQVQETMLIASTFY